MAGAMRSESGALEAAMRALSTEPSLKRQRAAQSAFKRATLAWKQAYAFRTGPFVASEAFQRAAFWPTRASLVDTVLTDEAPIDEARVEQLGVDARGLYALEYLLFDQSNARSMLLPSDGRGQRARAFGFQLSANVLGYAERIQRLLGDGREYAASFSNAGKQSADMLVAQARDTLSVISGKFARIERARSENLSLPFAVEGYFSGSSLEIVLAILDGAHRLYVGGGSGGLSALVASVSKPIDDHVCAAFDEAERRLGAMGMPIETALNARPERFTSAALAVAELRHVIEIEMASALS